MLFRSVGFRLDKTFKTYDGSEKPSTWLQDYFEAVRVARATADVAVRYLPLMLRGTARQWLNDLEPNSIHCWVNMQIAFTKNFEGTYKRSFTVGDLQRCVQQPDESSRAFLARWFDMKNSCEGIHDQEQRARPCMLSSKGWRRAHFSAIHSSVYKTEISSLSTP